jgi:hypothetical protein
MRDPRERTQTNEDGRDESWREVSQAEGDEPLGETDEKVGHTPDQAEGEDDEEYAQ